MGDIVTSLGRTCLSPESNYGHPVSLGCYDDRLYMVDSALRAIKPETPLLMTEHRTPRR